MNLLTALIQYGVIITALMAILILDFIILTICDWVKAKLSNH